ncbi:MAG: hypothetical protein PHT79_11825 [Syntrophomonadaceae bacterium]|nr:hypothetical protein [Syntrophomonadaceae bacterium]MDD4550432.1 hypothetical protein [Syntrophomonadaceae bacterium]
MFEDCIKCGICLQECFLQKLGINSFVSLPASDDPDGLWICCNCWICQEHCPVTLPLMNIKWQLQRNQQPPAFFERVLENIKACGHCIAIDEEEINDFREDIGLDAITLPESSIIQKLHI